MKIGIRILLATAVLLGTFYITTRFDPSISIRAAATTISQDQLHKEIVRALNERLSSFQVTFSGNKTSLKKDIKDTLNAAISSDDYLHYIVKTYGYNATFQGNTAAITFRFTYWETLTQTNEVKKRVTQTLSQVLTSGMNDHQKEKTIHDWIVTHIAYDKRLVSHSAYDGLINGRTVCQGYALLTYEMMKQAGIPVKIVEGTSRGIAHTWNLVRIGGQWYHLDSTWDDPVPDVAGRVDYNYYNLTDSQLRIDHRWKPSTSYPAAITPYDQTLTSLAVTDTIRAAFYGKFYEQLGYAYLTDSFTATNLQTLTSKIQAAVDNRQQELVIRYTKGASVTSDMKKAFAALKGLSIFNYSYEDYTRTTINDKLLRIVFKYSS
ncbi:transglutaminase domain-containing protein [Cohnella silvisoli]|uniref:Transglutaminase domain-containing protein n=1 Tax=Cohnella silvisoli TaxID=2873699 RepID=A0ABV1KMS9_9BACL|nr:transglutaminase domain-containing protein [Cohnella silvisoli]MCD9020276.1 transglutaminase [Cohnella silvisoli]